MKNIKILTALLTVFSVLFSACTKKEEITGKTQYAKVVVDVANLPGTPKLEVRYQGQLIGEAPLRIPGTLVEAAATTKLSVYVKGTDELVADTTLHLKGGELTSYRVAYNKELGIAGWLNSKPVAADSISFQFLNNLSDFNKTHPVYDFYLFYFDFNIGDAVPQGFVIPDFQKVKLYPTAITLPWAFPTDLSTPIYYLGKLKDRATGQFVTFGSGNDFFIFEQDLGGSSLIYSINDANIDTSVPGIKL
ncbi:hypothetical protein BDD43_3585 [Mucilaginibacter gracilis]|uniref:DUF4397 domain-containing protein n=1 Tax=Mucilaginibacter gracilis TaxID=423350 RepID=A0A495J4R4_9SPHI|nr:hypothetical protein [Mucilaginibacter gracilis]RKR83378.1 hypothetical protein BDD43_3585 [Mucilaginibacter gracilis]